MAIPNANYAPKERLGCGVLGIPGQHFSGHDEEPWSGHRMSDHLLSSWHAFQTSVVFAVILTLAMASLGIVTIVSGIICRGLRMLTRRLAGGRVTLTLH